MKTSAMMLCEKAVVREGMLHILGAGARLITRPTLPAPMGIDVAFLFEPESAEELTASHTVRVEVRSSSAEEVAKAEILLIVGLPGEVPAVLPGLPVTVPLQNVAVNAYDIYTVSAQLDGMPIGSLKFIVEKDFPQGFTDSVGMSH